ncbi:MAG: hypothetical protein ACFFDN_44340 [Candidatus Hodarchaeota archaeon]
MLTNEELQKYIKKITDYMKNPDAQNAQTCGYLRDLSNVFHSISYLKQNGNYGMMDSAIFQFQSTLTQVPQDLKSEISHKLRELLLNFSRQLDAIAEDITNLENGSMDIFKAIANLFLCVENLFRLKDSIASYPRPGPFPM